MKNTLFGILAGCLLLAGTAAAADDVHHLGLDAYSQDVITLNQETWIEGRVIEVRHGQVFVETGNNEVLQVPPMAVFWGTSPRVSPARVSEGDLVAVRLPENYLFRVVDRAGYEFTMSTYEGVYHIPLSTVLAWDVEDDSVADR